jgi:hypothetical protein
METGDPALFDAWFERWNDLAGCQVYPVSGGRSASNRPSREC